MQAEPKKETVDVPPVQTSASPKPDLAEKSKLKSAPQTTINVNNLLKVGAKKETQATTVESKTAADQAFTPEQLRAAWNEFAEQRKIYQAEYQLLSLEYELRDSLIVVQLMNPIQETLLNNFRSELITYLREKLNNSSLQVTSVLKGTDDGKKVMYTSREKFEFLMEKNPALKELKDRLELDTDF